MALLALFCGSHGVPLSLQSEELVGVFDDAMRLDIYHEEQMWKAGTHPSQLAQAERRLQQQAPQQLPQHQQQELAAAAADGELPAALPGAGTGVGGGRMGREAVCWQCTGVCLEQVTECHLCAAVLWCVVLCQTQHRQQQRGSMAATKGQRGTSSTWTMTACTVTLGQKTRTLAATTATWLSMILRRRWRRIITSQRSEGFPANRELLKSASRVGSPAQGRTVCPCMRCRGAWSNRWGLENFLGWARVIVGVCVCRFPCGPSREICSFLAQSGPAVVSLSLNNARSQCFDM